jgi:HD-like signal output (HDOD) protein
MFAWLRHLFSASDAGPAPAPTNVAAPARKAYFADDWVTSMQRDQIDFMFAGRLFEAEQHTEVFTNSVENAIIEALEEVVQSNEAGAHLLRRLPGVIPQLLQSLRSGDFSGPELARKISTDLVLVAEVLRLANSVAYSPGKTITSVDHAILILGQDGLRQLITSVAFKPIIDLRSGSFTRMVAPRLWEQSERCALANRLLSTGQNVDPLQTFLAGLIHNIGLTVSLRVIDRMADPGRPVGSPTFCNALAGLGRTLAYNIGSDWHFPDSVMSAIREQGDNKPFSALSPVGKILFMGDYLSKMDILARHRRLDIAQPQTLAGLTTRELECLGQLAQVEERDWLASITAGGKEAAART